jgi:hypothetical protein
MWYVNFTTKGGPPTISSQRSAFVIGDVLFHSPFYAAEQLFIAGWMAAR